MKCIKSTIGTVLRVTDDEAEKMVRKSNWVYTSKKEWKENVRDVKKKEVKEEDAVKELEKEIKPKKVKKPKRNRRTDK